MTTESSTTVSEDQSGSPEANDNNTIMAVAISAVILIAGGVTGLLALGGSVDLTVNMQGDNVILKNDSQGVFSGYDWNVTDETGEMLFEKRTSGKTTVVWRGGSGTSFTVTLTGYTVLGLERSAEHKFGSYAVIWGSYSIDVGVNIDDYNEYKDHKFNSTVIMPRWPGDNINQALLREYTSSETTSGSFDRIVMQLKAQAPEGPTKDQVNYLMGFVQNLDGENTYKSDISPYAPGNDYDYWNFPMETLFNKGGDCEDLAILLMALCREYFDQDTYMALAIYWGDGTVKGHAIATFSLDEPPLPGSGKGRAQLITSEYQYEGRTYYTCEVVSAGWEIGRIQTSYHTMDPDRFIVLVP